MADFFIVIPKWKSLKVYKNADHFCSLKIFLKTTWKKKKNKDILSAVTVSDTLAEFAGQSYGVRNLLNAVERLFKFLVVLPASNATAERSFSTLRRLKNYLRLTRPMTQERLNHDAVHHVHKTRVEQSMP